MCLGRLFRAHGDILRQLEILEIRESRATPHQASDQAPLASDRLSPHRLTTRTARRTRGVGDLEILTRLDVHFDKEIGAPDLRADALRKRLVGANDRALCA